MKTLLRCLSSAAVFAVASFTAFAAGGDTYVVFEGKGAVSTLTTTGAGNTTVAPADNPSTKADGAVSEVTTGKHKGEFAFHGTLNDAPDPDPGGIGWGLVKKAPGDAMIVDTFASTASLIQVGVTQLLEMDKNCNAIDNAADRIQGAIDKLAMIKTSVAAEQTAGHTTAKSAKAVTDDAQELIDLLIALKSDVVAIKADAPTTFEELLQKLAPFKKKGKKVNKLMKDIAKGLVKGGIFN